MAFPDYGPIEMITQYTQDGIRQGSYLYHMFSTPGEALHTIGVMFAMVGFISIIMIRSLHEFKVIVCWIILVGTLLFGQAGGSNPMFTPVNVNVKVDNEDDLAQTNTYAFTPQAAVVHFMSKLHRAIYSAFFDIEADKPTLRNIVQDVTTGATMFNPSASSLYPRSDVQQEVLAYQTLCGDSSNLSLDLYDQTWADRFRTMNQTLVSFNASAQQLSPADTWALQQKTFVVEDVDKLMNNYKSAFESKSGELYAPFGVVFDDEAQLRTTYDNAGISTEKIEMLASAFSQSNMQMNFQKYYTGIGYYATQRGRFNPAASPIQEGGTDPLATIPSTPPTGMNGISPNNNLTSPVLTYTLSGTEALTDHGNAQAAAIADARSKHSCYLTGTCGSTPTTVTPTPTNQVKGYQTDPIEQRLEGRKTVVGQSYTTGRSGYGVQKTQGQSEYESWMEFKKASSGAIATAPIAIAFMTPAPEKVYKTLDEASTKGSGTRNISRLLDNPYVNVITNCAQLHQMTRQHILEAALFQNAWPSHQFGVSITDGVNPTSTSTGEVARVGGFSSTYNSSEYMLNPYNALGGARTTKEMQAYNTRIQSMIAAMTFTDGDVQRNVFRSNQASTASEALRRNVAGSIINNALRVTIFPTIKGINGEEIADPLLEKQNKHMQMAADGANARDNLAGPSSALTFFADVFSNLAAKIGANFAGIGAVAYLKFLQIFIAIAMFFLIMCTPILFMVGMAIPKNAPGILTTSIITVLSLKAIPIGFTLVDAVISITASTSSAFLVTGADESIRMYAIAGAYTSVTMITFFLMFKSGDTQAVMGKLAELDRGANQIADTGVTATKVVAGAAVAGGAAGAMGAIGAAKAGGGIGKMASVGMRQGAEVFGARGAQAIPGAGNFMQEITGSYREGKGQATVMQEVDKNNASIDAKVANINKMLADPNISSEKHSELLAERDRELSHKRSYSELITANKDNEAEGKYRKQIDSGKTYFAEGRMAEQMKAGAAASGMDAEEVRRRKLDSQTQAGMMGTLAEGIKHQQLNADEVTMEASAVNVTADPNKMNTATKDAILNARAAAKSTEMRTSDSYIQQRALNSVNSEIANLKKDMLGDVSGGNKNTSEYTDPKTGNKHIFDANYDKAASNAVKEAQKNGDKSAQEIINAAPRSLQKQVSEQMAVALYKRIDKGEELSGEYEISASVINEINSALKASSTDASGNLDQKAYKSLQNDFKTVTSSSSNTSISKAENKALFNALKNTSYFKGTNDADTMNMTSLITRSEKFQQEYIKELEKRNNEYQKELGAMGTTPSKRNS